jgi:acetyl esterase/lipase
MLIGRFLDTLVPALLMTLSAAAASTAPQATTPTVERNVVYGMLNGLALLVDVHRPDKPNGVGIVTVVGTGFHSSPAYGSPQMKDDAFQLGIFVKPLVGAGYTVFVINYRTTPTFRHPAAVEDVERAVRFVRHNATRFGVAADRIGAVGGSSGGYLVSMLGVRSGNGNPTDPDETNRQAARVQAVVAFCPPEDLTAEFNSYGVSAVAAYIGSARSPDPKSQEWQVYRDASPLYSVSPDDSPILLIHGDKDPLVPIEHSEKMEAALKAANVATKLVRVPGAGHAMSPNPEKVDYTAEMIRWFDAHLRTR